jgi:hypothetical protein
MIATKSIIDLEKSIDDVLADMVTYVIENEIRTKPYISVLSKKQLWFGNGPHFNNAEKEVKAGLRANLGIKIPTDIEVEKKRQFYGYDALVKPWGELNNVTNRVMRNRILKRIIDSKELNDIRILLGRGYIRKDGTLDPKQTKGISVYVLFLADNSFREEQNKWIASQAEWMRLQIARNQHTHSDILTEKKAAASSLVLMNKKLLKQEEWKQLEPSIDRDLITWDVDD